MTINKPTARGHRIRHRAAMYLTPRLFRPTTRSLSSQPTRGGRRPMRRRPGCRDRPAVPYAAAGWTAGNLAAVAAAATYSILGHHIRATLRRLPTTDCRVRLDTACCAPSDFVRPTDQPCREGCVVVLVPGHGTLPLPHLTHLVGAATPDLLSTPWRAAAGDGATGLARVEMEARGPLVTAMPPTVQLRGCLTLSPWGLDQLTRRA